MSKTLRPVAAGLLVGLCAALIIMGLDWLFSRANSGTAVNPLQTLEMQTYDWRLTTTARPETARKDIVLVEIDEYSLRNMEQFAGRWPWPRLFHASLLDFLARGQPKVVAYDVNFASPDPTLLFDLAGTKWTGAQSDEELVKSARKAANLVVVADATYEVDAAANAALNAGNAVIPDQNFPLDAPDVIERELVFLPYAGLRDAVSGYGHNLAILDPDGAIRHMTPFVRSQHRALPSLGVAAAVRAAGISPREIQFHADSIQFADRARMPLTARSIISQAGVTTYKWTLLNFRGPALLDDLVTRPYASYHFWDLWKSEQLILGGEKPEVDPSIFKDKI